MLCPNVYTKILVATCDGRYRNNLFPRREIDWVQFCQTTELFIFYPPGRLGMRTLSCTHARHARTYMNYIHYDTNIFC